MIFKRLAPIVAALALVAAPQASLVHAAEEIAAPARFCSRLESVGAATLAKIEKEEGRTKQRRSTATFEREQARQRAAAAIATEREERDTVRQAHLALLAEQAATDSQKVAVTAFQAAQAKAVSEHRAALDTARKDYQRGLDALLASRKQAYDEAFSAAQQAVRAAVAQAESDCAGERANQAAIRRAFFVAIKEARAELTGAGQAVESFKDRHELLVEARKDAFKEADTVFKNALATARRQLKAAFEASSPSPSATPAP